MDSITLPEETALKVKQLEVKCENLEADIKMTDCCFNELDADQEEDRDKIEDLEKRVTQLETDLESVPELFEGKIAKLKLQNLELRDHLNLVTDTLNNVVKILNDQVIDEEPVVEENPDGEILYPKQDMEDDTQHTLKEVVYTNYEVTTPHEDMYEDTQPTLSQVYAMYQSQPPDEEGWDEMTAAIKAAEEYKASRKANQNE